MKLCLIIYGSFQRSVLIHILKLMVVMHFNMNSIFNVMDSIAFLNTKATSFSI